MATCQIPVPNPMKCTGQDLANNWKIFRESYEDYVIATDPVKKNEVVQVATLRSLMGTECIKVLKLLQLTKDEVKGTKISLDNLGEFFFSARNVSYERYLFHNSVQQPHKTIDQFVITQVT